MKLNKLNYFYLYNYRYYEHVWNVFVENEHFIFILLNNRIGILIKLVINTYQVIHANCFKAECYSLLFDNAVPFIYSFQFL